MAQHAEVWIPAEVLQKLTVFSICSCWVMAGHCVSSHCAHLMQNELTLFESSVGVARTTLPELKGKRSFRVIGAGNSAVGRGNPW